ncbi:MAG: GNAT family N-acetyltransferase [Deltaproteobacteria bacterium]
MTREWLREPYSISTAPERLDLDVIHAFISSSYWAPGRSRERVERSIAHSLPFGLYHSPGEQRAQVGFARVVTDYSTFAYLADVFVLEAHRGRGLGVWLVETVLAVPELAGARWMLGTRDAHELYRKFEFQETPSGLIMRRDGIDQRRS